MNNKKFERGVEPIVGTIIKNKKGEILLAKSPKWHNKWVIPGGHIEPGETIEEAGLREGKEEVGLDLKYLGVVGSGEMINNKDFHRPAHFIYFDVLCEVDGQEVKIDNDELKEYKWVTPQVALKMDLAGGTMRAVGGVIKFLK